MTLKRTAKAWWDGSLREGKGRITTTSQALKEAPYSFSTRFAEGITGTNPEELVAAAHASCFSMALSAQLEQAGLSGASHVETTADVTMERQGSGWSVTGVHLTVQALAPGISREKFENLANDAKNNCPISKLLNAKITMSTELREQAA